MSAIDELKAKLAKAEFEKRAERRFLVVWLKAVVVLALLVVPPAYLYGSDTGYAIAFTTFFAGCALAAVWGYRRAKREVAAEMAKDQV